MKSNLKNILTIFVRLIMVLMVGMLIIYFISENNINMSPSKPVLDEGMIPVVIANDGTVTTVSLNNKLWYNYEQKKWANAILVNSEARNDYLGTDGKSVNQDDILAYYVWIPRYKYKGTLKKCSNLENPTVLEYPECYSLKLSRKNKKRLIIWRKAQLSEFPFSTKDDEKLTEQAKLDIDELLKMGEMSGFSIDEVIEMYNEETNSNITYTSNFKPNKIISDGLTTIDIAFESEKSLISRGNAATTFRTHPAFIWGGKKLPGIWVGKFELSAGTESECYRKESEDNCKNVEPRILPNVKQLEYQSIGTQFRTSLKFARGVSLDGKISFIGNNVYGLSAKTDSHMMKNSEWGAVAYLSHSKYRINDNLGINGHQNNITGCGLYDKNTCKNKYGEANSYPQSTTGNISGIFDMAGGSLENVMGILSYDDDISDYDAEITISDNKYYDLYLQDQFVDGEDYNVKLCTLKTCGGHALYETAGWDTIWQWNDFVSESQPWFRRGDDSIFSIDSGDGTANSYSSWRSVLIVGVNK